MLQISEIVKKTVEMFDLFNEHFYDNELTSPAITVSPDGGRGAYGWCSINEIWNASDEKYREINLCAEYLDRPIFDLAAALLHEMAHLYNLVHDIQDVSNNGYYQNMKFKATAEAHGLHIEKHQKYGWTVTTLAPEAEVWIRETIGEASINASRLQELGTTKGGSKKSKNRSIKIVTVKSSVFNFPKYLFRLFAAQRRRGNDIGIRTAQHAPPSVPFNQARHKMIAVPRLPIRDRYGGKAVYERFQRTVKGLFMEQSIAWTVPGVFHDDDDPLCKGHVIPFEGDFGTAAP